ncbi:Sec-independent protein translocase TatB [Brevibacterium spongiae]|uniref:Sec-independent protein translocase TatB n=1 Tax=Brevibacterium spongiae TaxID=2909672 RepID=A0ABY5SVV0_9MICO|nr:Sec-independent protein translocase TatB [Brevibacterium spongiae]UVI37161.1 Sec-independent protein translocase TatB [Brevibacterium spongiae]
MFGLSFEKLIIVGIIAAIVIGPQRLPHYAQKLREFASLFRAQVDSARNRAAESMGTEDWQTLDPRQYDPRRIIREALDEPSPAPAEAAGRYVVTGSSGHPRKRFVARTGEGRAGDEGNAGGNSATER